MVSKPCFLRPTLPNAINVTPHTYKTKIPTDPSVSLPHSSKKTNFTMFSVPSTAACLIFLAVLAAGVPLESTEDNCSRVAKTSLRCAIESGLGPRATCVNVVRKDEDGNVCNQCCCSASAGKEREIAILK